MIAPALRAAFADPPRAFSPVPIWWWSGEPLRSDRLRWQLERFAEGGVFNLVILNLAPSGPLHGCEADDPPFLSEAWWEIVAGVCEDARSLGISLWFYDQLGFSGANLQASLVRERPEWAGQWLEPGGRVVTRGFDYFSREACAALIDRVHGEFARRLGDHLGTTIVGSFQDELPSLPTWSRGFAEEFRRRCGYDLAVAELWEDGQRSDQDAMEVALSEDDTARVRRDYHATRAALAEEAFFRPLFEWHERHGLICGCDQQDPARAGHPVDAVRTYADYPRTHRWFGAPGSDHHGDARIHSSLAHLYGRPRTWIEAFHSTGWGGTLEETFDWLLPWLRAGANLYDPHAVYYSTRGGWWEWAPPATDWRQPYWRHHGVFAHAVARLCAALSLGRHVCDVGVLFPTTTVQAGTGLDGETASARRAHDVYLDLVGDMTWFRLRPGALDRLRLDFDVLDDDSVQRASVSEACLRIADEAYAAVILPACVALEEETAARLCEFVESGGRLVAVGEVSPLVEDHAVVVSDPAELGRALPSARVDAPVPALVREIDGTTLVFLCAAFPRATRARAGDPGARGVGLGWIDVEYEFDPGAYHREMRVRVEGVIGAAVLLEPFAGTCRELASRADGDGVVVDVPFDDGPAVLLAFGGDPGGDARRADAGALDLGELWEVELIPTIDNRWGDFARPPATGPFPVERWEVRYRAESPDDDGERDGWTRADLDDGDWPLVRATFGPRGVCDGRPLVYSLSRGIDKDPIHRETLGPKGRVPEEFLDFGVVEAGQTVRFRCEVELAEPVSGHLAVGAAARKRAWIDGVEVLAADAGYLSIAPVELDAGVATLDLELVAEEAGRLRAHFAVIRDPEAYRRPEWIRAEVAQASDPAVIYRRRFNLPAHPERAMVQVGAIGPCRVLVNGEEAGRQGGFDPYFEQQSARLARYDIVELLRGGSNEIAVEATGSVIVDARIECEGGPVVVCSDASWEADDPISLRARQWGDPAWTHLWPRPHPLPGARWLNGGDDQTVVPLAPAVPGSRPGVAWLRFEIPPAAVRMEVPARGQIATFVNGEPLTDLADTAGEPRRICALRVQTTPGREGGAVLDGPIRFATDRGAMRLGDWEKRGLRGYSGGVRYRTTVALAPDGTEQVLDLGRIRGTAEVRVNGTPAGVRVCSPFRFDVSSLLRRGDNTFEIEVFNTLGPYLDAVSPTHFVFDGQRESGLFGPVRLVTRR